MSCIIFRLGDHNICQEISISNTTELLFPGTFWHLRSAHSAIGCPSPSRQPTEMRGLVSRLSSYLPHRALSAQLDSDSQGPAPSGPWSLPGMLVLRPTHSSGASATPLFCSAGPKLTPVGRGKRAEGMWKGRCNV